MSIPLRQRVDQLIEYIKTGRIIEAMTEFYAPNVSMQENLNPPVVGRGANIEREKQFLSNVKVFRNFTVLAAAVEGNVSFVESTMEFQAQNGAEVKLTQVSVARWEGSQIVHERFYYDSAAK